MLKYNLCYIKRRSQVLLLNRDYPGWMGCWNGVGGKIELDESPRKSMLREIREETGLVQVNIQFKGLKTWSKIDGTGVGGLYLYVGCLDDNHAYPTPVRTEEGILEWKEIDWILHPDNLGIPDDLPTSLRVAFTNRGCFDHHSIFAGNNMIQETMTEISPQIEHDLILRNEYLNKYQNRLP